jgi:phage shock protein B
MPPEFLVPVLIVFIVVGLPIMSATLIKLAKIMKGESGNSDRKQPGSSREEAEIMQEIHRSLSRLEKRIDSLETIVLENPQPKS